MADINALYSRLLAADEARDAAAGPPGLAEPLTSCELEVLWLLAAGKFEQRIATTWWRSNGQKHVTHILGKLGATDRTEAGTGPGSWALVP